VGDILKATFFFIACFIGIGLSIKQLIVSISSDESYWLDLVSLALWVTFALSQVYLILRRNRTEQEDKE